MDDVGGAPPPPPPPPSAGGGGPIPVRQLGDILTSAFELYKANASKLIGIVAVVAIPAALLGSFFRNVVFDPTDVVDRNWFVSSFVGLVGTALAILVAAVLQAAVTRAAAQATIGDPVDVTSSYRWGFSRLGAVLVVAVLLFLVILGGLILFVIPGLIFAVMLSVSIPALVIEGKRGTEALGRSWQLVKGHFWHVVGVVIVSAIITGLVNALLSAIGGDNFFLAWIFDSIGFIITTPFTALVYVLLYIDLRARAEALTGDGLRMQISRTS